MQAIRAVSLEKPLINLEARRYKDELEVYKSILVEYPDNLNANLYTAQCLEAMGENAKAIDAYEKVLSLDPTNSEIRQSIVTIKRNSTPLAKVECYFQMI